MILRPLLVFVFLLFSPFVCGNNDNLIQKDEKENEVEFPLHPLRGGGGSSWNRSSDYVGYGNNSCYLKTSCENCSELSSLCHWCEKDKKCHAIGSIHGCAWGMSCHKKEDDEDKKNSTHKDSCSLHNDCSTCTNSHLCHWCGHDHACHTIGSIYGCVSGVDCYSNDVCKRAHPEPIKEVVLTQMSKTAIIITVAFATVLILCTSCCFCCASKVKGSFDDLMESTATTTNQMMTAEYHNPYTGATYSNRSLLPPLPPAVQIPRIEQGEETEENNSSNNNVQQQQTAAPEVEATVPISPVAAGTEVEEEGQAQEQREEEVIDVTDEYAITTVDSDNDRQMQQQLQQPLLTRTYMTTTNNNTRVNKSKNMQCIYRCCSFIYVLSLIGIIGGMLSVIHYFPKVPEYNICNDEVAWKSLIETITKVQVDASFEILMSVKNTNSVDVVLDMGRGTIKHGLVTIGTYELPPSIQADAMSITDLLIVADISPDKWEALSLTTEYYSGKLILYLDGQFNVRIPTLFNYSFEVDIKDKEVRLNEESDRKLCSCQHWTNQTSNTLSFFDGLFLN